MFPGVMASGQIIAGKYELRAMLARGGMGSVWRARHILLDVDVAVKLMAPALLSSADQRIRFGREAKAAAQIKSSHVVKIHDYGFDGETPYMVMELLDGEDLGACLRREKRLSPARAAELLAQIARGLHGAHELGIIHRDLKPANIFLARADDAEVVKILDFGIARAGGHGGTSETTMTGDVLGSPPYMSPEQVRGLKSIDHRTDLWSVGVVLYRALTGRLPFQGDGPGDLILKICKESPPPPSSLAPELPGALDAFFGRVFQREPDARFASIREMADAFVQAIAPRAPAPRPALSSLPEAAPAGPMRPQTVRMDELPRDVQRSPPRASPAVVAAPPSALLQLTTPMRPPEVRPVAAPGQGATAAPGQGATAAPGQGAAASPARPWSPVAMSPSGAAPAATPSPEHAPLPVTSPRAAPVPHVQSPPAAPHVQSPPAAPHVQSPPAAPHVRSPSAAPPARNPPSAAPHVRSPSAAPPARNPPSAAPPAPVTVPAAPRQPLSPKVAPTMTMSGGPPALTASWAPPPPAPGRVDTVMEVATLTGVPAILPLRPEAARGSRTALFLGLALVIAAAAVVAAMVLRGSSPATESPPVTAAAQETAPPVAATTLDPAPEPAPASSSTVPSATPSAVPSATPSAVPSATPSAVPSATPSAVPSAVTPVPSSASSAPRPGAGSASLPPSPRPTSPASPPPKPALSAKEPRVVWD